VRAQIRAQESGWAVEFAREIVRSKVKNQFNLLRYLGKYEARERPGFKIFLGMMARRLDDLTGAIRGLRGGDVTVSRERLFAIEGQAAILYWEGVRFLLEGRGEFLSRERRGATDPINRLLNYGYAVLYPRIQNACMRQGLDPGLGFLHATQEGKAALVLDLVTARYVQGAASVHPAHGFPGGAQDAARSRAPNAPRISAPSV